MLASQELVPLAIRLLKEAHQMLASQEQAA
jgi:hypothetical protein